MKTIQKFTIEHALYPAMERFRGNQIRVKTEHLRTSERLSAEQLREMQSRKLAALLKHCAEHVPAYHALGWDVQEIQRDPFAFLTSIPVLPKAAFQAAPENYLSDDANPAMLIPNRTGGSTGEPVHFYMTRGQVEAYEAARWRGLSWFGITPGSRCVMIWGNPIELTQNAQRKYQLRERMLKNRIIVSAYQLSSESRRFIEIAAESGGFNGGNADGGTKKDARSGVSLPDCKRIRCAGCRHPCVQLPGGAFTYYRRKFADRGA